MSARRFVVGVSGSAGSLQALRYAAELARSDGAELMPVLAWTPPRDELVNSRYPSSELPRMWVDGARDRLRQAIELAFGGPPAGVTFSPTVVRGQAGRVLTEVAGRPGDVLVIGAGRHGALHRLLGCHVSRYCCGHARCPIIAVPPSPLEEELYGFHGWLLRHRMNQESVGLHAAELKPPVRQRRRRGRLGGLPA